jgi:hypothetical protein
MVMKRALPMYLWLVLAILFVQIIVTVFGGSILLYAISSVPGAGPLYFVVWFSLLASVVLAVSALLLVPRYPWARYPVIGIEALAVVSGLVSVLTTGTSAGLANITFGVCATALLHRADVREWLTDTRTPPGHWPSPVNAEIECATGPRATYGWPRD